MKFDVTYFLLRVLIYYYYCIFPGFSRIQLKNIKICGGPRDSVKLIRSSWSAKVCPGVVYNAGLSEGHVIQPATTMSGKVESERSYLFYIFSTTNITR
jgi:hypothetical protein